MPTDVQNNSEVTQSPTPLTPERGSDILFHSFRFSQGNIMAQHVLFDLIHYKHQEWNIDNELFSQIIDTTKHRVNNYLFPPEQVRQHHVPELIIVPMQRNITPKKAGDMLTNMADTMKQCFTHSERNQKSRETHLNFMRKTLLQSMIVSDIRFLKWKGRPRMQESAKWSSYFREYILGGRAFGVTEIDEVLQDLRNIWKSEGPTITLPNQNATSLLAELSKAWDEHHPGENFYQVSTKTEEY